MGRANQAILMEWGVMDITFHKEVSVYNILILPAQEIVAWHTFFSYFYGKRINRLTKFRCIIIESIVALNCCHFKKSSIFVEY